MTRVVRGAGAIGAAVMLLAAPLAARAQGAQPSSAQEQVPANPELEAQVKEIASELRCPVCRGLSIYDSPSEMAQEMQQLVREKLQAGMTPDEVKAYFVARYGEWILLEPKASGFNWTVWLLPLAVLAGGVLFVFLTARRWVARGRAREASLLEGQNREL